MTEVTVIVVTHGLAGQAMLEAVGHLGGRLPGVHALAIAGEDGPEDISRRVDALLAQAGSQTEPLFLLDLAGSTPARLCAKHCAERGAVVGGLNLAMLMKLVSADRSHGARQLAEELAASARKSIFVSAPATADGPKD